MKQFKKFSALLLALTLVMGLVSGPALSTNAATKVKKPTVTVTKQITLGETGKVSLKNLQKGQKVNIAIKNKKILKAAKSSFLTTKAGNKTVTLKAQNVGKTTVTIKVSTKAKGSWSRIFKKSFNVSIQKRPSADDDIADRLKTEKPWLNPSVGNAVQKGYKPELKDDFYTAANYDKLNSLKLDPTHTSEGTLAQVSYDVEKSRRTLITDTSIKGHDADLVRNFYNLYMDWETRNKTGLTEIQPVVDKLEAVKTIDDLTAFFLSDEGQNLGVGLSAEGVGIDPSDSSKYTVQIYSTNLTLGDSDEYSKRTAYGDMLASYYGAQASYMLGRFGYTDKQVKEILAQREAFEKKLAPSIISNTAYNEIDKKDLINTYTLEEIRTASPNYPLAKLLEVEGMSASKTFNIQEPTWLKKLNTLYTEKNLAEMKSYILATMVTSYITRVDEQAFRKYQDIYNQVVGATESDPDDLYAISACRSMLGTCVAKMYIQKYSSAEVKKDITALCEHIRESYRTIIKNEDWMSDATKEKALEKLNAIRVNAVYPDRWTDYSKLTFKSKEQGGTYLQARLAINDFALKQMKQCINKSVDKSTWSIEQVDEVNAYYNPTDNSVNIIAGILNGDIYNINMSEEEKLGKIGYVIGHEMSHAFDINGSQYDKDGNVADWWTAKDKTAFKNKSKKLVSYFNNMTMFDGSKCNGTLKQGEIVADMGGIKAALTYASTKPDFDYDKFFRAAADMWCSITTPASAQMLFQDEHPSDYLRVNAVLQQFEEFHKQYDIKKGDGMYLAPEDRVLVW
ncbi:putative endopeptidase [Lachnospiraceae bacterium XBB1006]|nr:putative endopeptidase [Lachnospiraceae bacterium XBB1006]